MAECVVCGMEIPGKWWRKYCSDKCRDKARQKPERRPCEVCGTPLKRAQVKFCSNRCKQKAAKQRKAEKAAQKPLVRFICEICGKEFFRVNKRKRVVCGNECRAAYEKLYHKEYDTRGRVEKGKTDYPNWTFHKDERIRRDVQFWFLTGQIDRAKEGVKFTDYEKFLRWSLRGSGLVKTTALSAGGEVHR